MALAAAPSSWASPQVSASWGRGAMGRGAGDPGSRAPLTPSCGAQSGKVLQVDWPDSQTVESSVLQMLLCGDQ